MDLLLVLTDPAAPLGRQLIDELQAAHFLTMAATTCEKACGLAAVLVPLAVVIDLDHDEAGGLKLLEERKTLRALKQIPVLVLSERPQRDLGPGVTSLLRPGDRRQLISTLRTLCVRRGRVPMAS